MSEAVSGARRERLTNARIERLKARPREYALHDSVIEGLAIRVQPGGAKSWIYRRSLAGRLRRVTLGRFPLMGAAEARAAAATAKISGPAALPDIGAIRRRTPLFRDFAEEFFEKRGERHWAGTTVASARRYLRNELDPAFGDTPVGEITHTQVLRWFLDYGRRASGGANQALSYLAAIFKAAVDWGHLPCADAIPSKGVKRHRRPRIGRPLTEKELARLGEALDKTPRRERPSAQAIKLILLTGCRTSEILRIRWKDWQDGRLAVCGKTGKRVVFLGREAGDHLSRILETRRWPSKGGVQGYVFPSPRDPSRPLSDLNASWKYILEDAGLPKTLRLHDLRHTFASIAVANGESLQIVGRLLGHSRISSTERYAHLDDKHIRAANQRISDAIERAILGGEANPHAHGRTARRKPRRLPPAGGAIDRPPATHALESP